MPEAKRVIFCGNKTYSDIINSGEFDYEIHLDSRLPDNEFYIEDGKHILFRNQMYLKQQWDAILNTIRNNNV